MHFCALNCIEFAAENRFKELEMALENLSTLVTENLGGTTKISILDIGNRGIAIDQKL